jgi:hypothetical protein
MKIAFATSRGLPGGWVDDQEAARVAGAEFLVWDDPGVDWEAFDRVVIRSVWDYSHRVEEFLAWYAAVGPERLRNTPELVDEGLPMLMELEAIEPCLYLDLVPGAAARFARAVLSGVTDRRARSSTQIR